jgi:hypothetical protein
MQLQLYPSISAVCKQQDMRQRSSSIGCLNRSCDTTYLHLGLALLTATLERMIPIAGMLMSDKAPMIVSLMSGCITLSARIPRPLP